MPIERVFEQGSVAWKQWRKAGIGASDAPVIMGESPWSSRYDLWEQKTGRGTERPANFYMRRGTRLEHVARRLYIESRGTHVEPVCMESEERSWMRASLDGWSAAAGLVVEIKCPGAKDHAVAQSGKIPAKYYPQLQHLLAVSRAALCHYVSYRDDELVVLMVKPRADYIDRLVREEQEFWDCVQTGRVPRGMVV